VTGHPWEWYLAALIGGFVSLALDSMIRKIWPDDARADSAGNGR